MSLKICGYIVVEGESDMCETYMHIIITLTRKKLPANSAFVWPTIYMEYIQYHFKPTV